MAIRTRRSSAIKNVRQAIRKARRMQMPKRGRTTLGRKRAKR